jgi:hypothetical protein
VRLGANDVFVIGIHDKCGGAVYATQTALRCEECGKRIGLEPSPSCPADSVLSCNSPRPEENRREGTAQAGVRPAVVLAWLMGQAGEAKQQYDMAIETEGEGVNSEYWAGQQVAYVKAAKRLERWADGDQENHG